jgi:hypothetical protein
LQLTWLNDQSHFFCFRARDNGSWKGKKQLMAANFGTPFQKFTFQKTKKDLNTELKTKAIFFFIKNSQTLSLCC